MRHTDGLARIEPDEDEALPGGAIADSFRFQVAEEGLFELQDVEDAIGGDPGLSGREGVGEQDIFVLVGTGRKDGSAPVDIGGIEQVEDTKVLDGKNLVHTFQAESTLAVQKI